MSNAEEASIGCVLLGGLDAVAAHCRPECFAEPWFGEVLKTALELREAGVAVDLITLAEAMTDPPIHQQRLGWLLRCTDAVPTAANAEWYARQVHDDWVARQAISGLRSSADELEVVGHGKALAARAAVARVASGIDQHIPTAAVSLTTAALGWVSKIEQSSGKIYWPTALAAFDGADYSRGLSPGQFIVVGARPGVGKTALALAVSLAAARTTRVLFVSLEMSEDELMARAIGAESGVDTQRLDAATRILPSDWPAIGLACSRLSERRMDFACRARCTVADIEALVAGQDYGVVAVDYVGLMAASSVEASVYQSREQQIAEISRALKAMAMARALCVVALAQINREAAKRDNHEPRLSDLRDSGALEQDADCVVLLHRDHVFDPDADPREAVAIVAKRRSGPIGRVPMRFTPETQRFVDVR